MRHNTLLAPILILALLCTACPKNRIREAAKASDRMATLIGSMIDLKRSLGATGQITREEELALTNHLLVANNAVKAFHAKARTITEDTASTRLELATAFNAVTNAINSMSTSAIFPIRDQEARVKFVAILNSINTSAQIIDSALRS